MSEEARWKVWWDEKDKVIRLRVWGRNDEQDVNGLVAKIAEIKRDFPGEKLRILLDLIQASAPSAPARKIIAKEIYKDPAIDKIAAIAPSILVRTVNSFLMKVSGVSDSKVKMFAAEAEALKWLKS